MPRLRLCKVCGGWHDIDEPWPVECSTPQRDMSGGFPRPMFISDTMDAVQSQTNGLWYDSKATLRREYKRAGVVEVGNETPKPRAKPKPDRKKIEAAVGRAWARVDLTS